MKNVPKCGRRSGSSTEAVPKSGRLLGGRQKDVPKSGRPCGSEPTFVPLSGRNDGSSGFSSPALSIEAPSVRPGAVSTNHAPGDGQIGETERAVVRVVARALWKRGGRTADLEELEAVGNVLLVEATLAYDPARRTSFRTFASRCVARGIVDHLRASKRARRRATEEDARAVHSAFDVGASQQEREDGGVLAVEMDRRTLVGALRAAIEGLGPIEAALVRGVYLEGRALSEVARSLGVKYAWAWEVRVRALETLRRRVVGGGDLKRASAPRGRACAGGARFLHRGRDFLPLLPDALCEA